MQTGYTSIKQDACLPGLLVWSILSATMLHYLHINIMLSLQKVRSAVYAAAAVGRATLLEVFG